MAAVESSQESSRAVVGDDVDQSIVKILGAAKEPQSAPEILQALRRSDFDVSPATLARRLDRLISEQHVVREGRARATRYRKDTYHDYFAVPPTKRTTVGYRPELLASYQPNKTQWLSAEVRRNLEEAGGGRRLDASTYSRAISQKLLVDLAYASSALEGNTYSYLDTQVLIEFGQAAEGKDRDETIMILNHKEAINYLIDHIDEIQIEPKEIKTFHALLSRGLSNMDPRDVGNVRRMPVHHIGGSAYVPLAIPQRIEDELSSIASKAREIENPHEQSLFLMAFISYLQAFRDVNKRTARLMCNVPLLKAGLAPLSFMEMDKTAYVRGLLSFYELNRTDLIADAYANGYERSAARYDAYTGRPKAVLDIEFKRRNDIFRAVKEYVGRIGEGNPPDSMAALIGEMFPSDDSVTAELLAGRVEEIVASLSEGNHMAYGIDRDRFASYEANIPASDTAPRRQ